MTDRIAEATPSGSAGYHSKLRLAEPQIGQGIADVFNRDTLELSLLSSVQEKEEDQSLWNRFTGWLSSIPQSIYQWFSPSTPTQEAAPPLTLEIERRKKPIPRVPVLDEPEIDQVVESERIKIDKRRLTTAKVEANSPEDYMLSLEQLVQSLMRTRLEMQEEKGAVSLTTFKKYVEQRKVAKEFLNELLDKIENNERFRKYFGYGQAATGLASIALTIFSFFAPVPGALAVAAGVGAAITTGGQSYYDKQKKADAAESTKKNFDNDVIGKAIEARRTDIGDAAETQLDVLQLLATHLRTQRYIVDLVSQRT